MTNKGFWVVLLVLVTLFLPFGGHAQAKPAFATTPAPAGSARIYVYRWDYDSFIYALVFNRTLSVKFAEAAGAPKELPTIAGLRKKRYFFMDVAPGKYVFDTRGMTGKLEIEVAAGETRFLRLDQGKECPSEDTTSGLPPSCEDRPASVNLMFTDVARTEMLGVKPIKKGDVSARNLVMVPGK
jgi:hypothetical protein